MAYSTLRAAIQAAIKQNDNEEITGNLLQSVLLSIVNTVGAGYNFAGVATPSTNPGTPDGAMFWIGGKGTYANFGSSVTIAAGYLGIFMWDGSAFTRSVLKLSGGEGVFDVSDYTGNEYANLSAALAAIPQEAKAGGMQIRFVLNSDHKYVQYRLMAQSFTTDETQWQGVDKELIPGSKNLVESGAVASEVGKRYSYSVEGSTHTKICDLTLKSGSKLLICVSGTSEATRLIIRANSRTGTTLADYVVLGRKYEITLPEDITSVWLWTNGSYDLDFDLYFGISMTLKNIIDNAYLSETGLYSVAVETGEGITIKEIIQSVDIKQGDVFYFIADGTINGNLRIRGNVYSGGSGTIGIRDEIVSGACYRIVATADIHSIGIYSDAPINCSIYFYTSALKETMELCSRVPSIEDDISALYRNTNQIQVTKSGSTNVKITDLNLPSGSHIYIKVNGSSSSTTRLIIRENSVGGNILQDYVKPGRAYDVITASDMTSLWLWANGEYDLNFNISTGIEREVTINSDSILNSQSGIFVSSFVKEDNTIVVKELIQDINVKTGETIYVSTVGTISGRLIIRANNYGGGSGSVTIKDYVEPGVIYKFVAPTDLIGVGVYCTGSANIRLYVYTKASVDIFKYSELYTDNLKLYTDNLINVINNNIGFEYKQEFSGKLNGESHKTAKVFENLTIKKNQKFSICINGYYNGRVLIRANSGTENTLIDYAKPYTWYDFTASIDITSIYVWYDVDLDVEFVIATGIDSELSKFNTNLLIPHTVLGSGITKSLAYKQLGVLSKAYICISDDDGHEGLGSYTLPMIIQKGIPFTACIFSTCPSILNNTYKALILDAYNNHGLCIAQHDGAYWDVMSEGQLYGFIEKEKAAFAEMGITVKGAAIPGHRTNYLVESVFGESYNVVRCGYNGVNTDGTPAYHTIYYKDGNSGQPALSVPRSNIYCLSSSNIKDYTLNGWKDIIDFAVANKMFVSIHMHDNDFVETADNYLSNRALLEGVIDYAKTKDITFVTLGDVDRIY